MPLVLLLPRDEIECSFSTALICVLISADKTKYLLLINFIVLLLLA